MAGGSKQTASGAGRNPASVDAMENKSPLADSAAGFALSPMPLIDLPLHELRQYAGRNPRPADFDDYWKRALIELDATDPRPVLKPAAFSSRA